MSEHITDRIHDYVDGELPEAGRRAVEDHVRSCRACADELARATEVAAAVRELPGRAEPPRDLWGGIRQRIDDTRVVDFPEPVDGLPAARPGRRVTLSLPQLFAAGIAVALLSGGAVWTAMGGPRTVRQAEVPAPEAPATGSFVRSAEGRYQSAVRELEALLEEGRQRLAPETLVTLERSLSTIDEAIAEAERALARDPGSELLHRILASHQKTKLRILRQAATAVPRT